MLRSAGNSPSGCRLILPVRSIEQKARTDMDLDCTQLLSHSTPNGHWPLRATVGTLASFIVVLLMAASSASAATPTVSGGQLLGASGVVVDGSSFDIAFLDGTCISLYNGCDAVSDFTFQTSAAALLASQALLDQVFLDGANLFDTTPALTFGCTSVTNCIALTPYGFTSGAVSVLIARALNGAGPGGNSAGAAFATTPTQDLTPSPNVVYAVWTPVPEPGSALLMGLGLIGLSIRNRREG